MLGFDGSVDASWTGGIAYNLQDSETFRGLPKIAGLPSLMDQGDQAWIFAL